MSQKALSSFRALKQSFRFPPVKAAEGGGLARRVAPKRPGLTDDKIAALLATGTLEQA
jgi:hypothetical protein